MKMHAVAGVLIAFVCLWHPVFSTILRLPCFTQADFKIFEIDKRLEGNVFSKHYDTSDVQCTVLCVENRKCRSYNIHVAKMICELNSKALIDNGTKLTDDMGWVYKSTNYSGLYVGPVCRDLKPCDNGILCRDTCSPPYYECVYCDNKHTGLHCDVPLDINECENNPCQNSGECVDKRVGYECTCRTGFTGKNCENYINGCDSLPCFNGGTCQNTTGSYNCTCAPHYSGFNCEVFDSCSTNPCQFYERCVTQVNNYTCVAATNIALHKKATQSSMFESNQAHYAVDGKSTTALYQNSCSHTGEEEWPWWEVDFGNTYSVAGVEITNRGDCCGERLKNFDVIVNGTLCIHRSEQLPQGESVKLPCSSMLRGRRLKVQVKYKISLALCEVKVYSPDQEYDGCSSNPCQFYERCVNDGNQYSCVTLTNIALRKAADQSSTFSTYTASLAVDGNKATELTQNSCTHTTEDEKPWWEVDFGNTYSVVGVEITNRGGCCDGRLSNFTVTVDATLCFHLSGKVAVGASQKIPCKATLNGRRLKIELLNKEFLTLCEVVVYSTD